MEKFDVYVVGFDGEPTRAAIGIEQVFGLEPRDANVFVIEVPRPARRGVSLEVAKQYEEALRAIGAQVELRPAATAEAASTLAAARARSPSLPTLPATLPPNLRASAAMNVATDDALLRWRASEDTLPGGDSRTAAIPGVPRLPHDLRKMPNARVIAAAMTDPPPWMMTDPNELRPVEFAKGEPESLEPPPASPGGLVIEDAQPEPVGDSAHPGPAGPHTVGMSPVSKRPGPLSMPTRPLPGSQGPDTMFARNTKLWLGLAVLVAIAGGAYLAFAPAASDGNEKQRLEGWAGQNLVGGDHARAAEWIDAPASQVVGASKRQVRTLIHDLLRNGAVDVHAVRISHGATTDLADALIVELPRDADLRRRVLWRLGRALKKQKPLGASKSQRYIEVQF